MAAPVDHLQNMVPGRQLVLRAHLHQQVHHGRPPCHRRPHQALRRQHHAQLHAPLQEVNRQQVSVIAAAAAAAGHPRKVPVAGQTLHARFGSVSITGATSTKSLREEPLLRRSPGRRRRTPAQNFAEKITKRKSHQHFVFQKERENSRQGKSEIEKDGLGFILAFVGRGSVSFAIQPLQIQSNEKVEFWVCFYGRADLRERKHEHMASTMPSQDLLHPPPGCCQVHYVCFRKAAYSFMIQRPDWK